VAATVPCNDPMFPLLLAIFTGAFRLFQVQPLLAKSAWWSRRHPDSPPFRLYALSYLESLLALVTYPFVVEPALGRHTQSLAWSGGFILFVIVSAVSAIRLWRSPAATAQPARDASAAIVAPRRLQQALWVGLPAACAVIRLFGNNTLSVAVQVGLGTETGACAGRATSTRVPRCASLMVRDSTRAGGRYGA